MLEREVVITGLGIISPIGVGREPVWESIAARRSGVRPLPHLASAGWLAPFGGDVVGFDPEGADPAAQKHQGHVPRDSTRVRGGGTGLAGRRPGRRPRSTRIGSA